jgi:hypothetical protein
MDLMKGVEWIHLAEDRVVSFCKHGNKTSSSEEFEYFLLAELLLKKESVARC